MMGFGCEVDDVGAVDCTQDMVECGSLGRGMWGVEGQIGRAPGS